MCVSYKTVDTCFFITRLLLVCHFCNFFVTFLSLQKHLGRISWGVCALVQRFFLFSDVFLSSSFFDLAYVNMKFCIGFPIEHSHNEIKSRCNIKWADMNQKNFLKFMNNKQYPNILDFVRSLCWKRMELFSDHQWSSLRIHRCEWVMWFLSMDK